MQMAAVWKQGPYTEAVPQLHDLECRTREKESVVTQMVALSCPNHEHRHYMRRASVPAHRRRLTSQTLPRFAPATIGSNP